MSADLHGDKSRSLTNRPQLGGTIDYTAPPFFLHLRPLSAARGYLDSTCMYAEHPGLFLDGYIWVHGLGGRNEPAARPHTVCVCVGRRWGLMS